MNDRAVYRLSARLLSASLSRNQEAPVSVQFSANRDNCVVGLKVTTPLVLAGSHRGDHRRIPVIGPSQGDLADGEISWEHALEKAQEYRDEQERIERDDQVLNSAHPFTDHTDYAHD